MRRDAILYFVLGGVAVALFVLFTRHGQTIAGLDDETFGRLAYDSILLVGLGALVFLASRLHLGQVLRSAVIWTAVFALLIGLYAFRPEFDALKNRVFAVLMPGSVVPIGADDGHPRFMATRSADGHFYLDGAIDGAPTSFIVDTGASVVAMDSRTAEALGIDMSSLHFTNAVMTANGIAKAAPIRLASVTIGGISRRDVQAAVTEGEGLDTVLLGMSFLETLTSYDFRGDRLVLTD
ncbi:TIGR02281 family clan AA aspartic protease [Jiella sonneratiae]|uniref:TIGR02281 family clan AA aspartic protease n=1 Tax=Jiella sonneratiae TaxID=2816856 RepID=A0ABS3J4E4_9HYPH|nr:TIGR02281 family clan AA aspartic protease [Jiella sonneratiae]MBO0904000.1 TIGR02281 family clan AA aspartic protease [Jiella sonneratiae]